MYSAKVTQMQIEQIEKKTQLRLKRYSVSQAQQYLRPIEAAFIANPKKPELREEQKAFIRNEILLSMLDFNYFLKYCIIDYDGCEGGGVGPFKLWEAQELVMTKIAKIEELAYDDYTKRHPTDGIRIVDHKSRQLGGTALGRALTMHRACLHPNQKCIAASIDGDKVLSLYDKDKLIYDSLPPWMKPSLDSNEGSFDVKAQHIKFTGQNSHILYQDSQQKTGMGQGRQFNVCHLTECASWKVPEVDIELNTFGTLPQYWMTLAILESTAMGRGNWWHDFTERVRKGRVTGWNYVFVPWYAEPNKYRRQPPENWKPSEATMAHAWRVFETSAEFIGKKVYLPKEQLYWYETTRLAFLESDTLNFFLTNYAATPEESFQHSSQSGFSTAVLEKMDLSVKKGAAYDLLSPMVN